MMPCFALASVLGIVGGFFGALTGIGFGPVLVPVLSFAMGMAQHTAQGTVLASMVLPISLTAVYEYHRRGQVDIVTALAISLGAAVGGFFGAQVSGWLDQDAMRKILGVVLACFSAAMFLTK